MGKLDYPYNSPVPRINWLIGTLNKSEAIEILRGLKEFPLRKKLNLLSEICEAYC